MAKAISRPVLTVKVTIEIDEEEARALDALAGYGANSAIEAFYKGCGKHYLEPYEKGLRSFLNTIASSVSPTLNHIDSARKYIQETKG